jgi:hypothetical protein
MALGRRAKDAPGHVHHESTANATAPPRLRCVMPAFVPGWDAFLQVPSPSLPRALSLLDLPLSWFFIR